MYIDIIDSILKEHMYANWTHTTPTRYDKLNKEVTAIYHVKYTNNSNEADISYSGMDVDVTMMIGSIFITTNTLGTDRRMCTSRSTEGLYADIQRLFPYRQGPHSCDQLWTVLNRLSNLLDKIPNV